MNNILVTGGAGFIGSHLVDKLKSVKSYDVDVIDLKIGTDIRNIENITNKTYDWIYHFAANADVRGGVDNTRVDLEHNIIGTHAILDYMRTHNCKKIIFTSSATVYGERKDIPTPEDAPDLKPISLYGASKLAAEKLICAYHHTFGTKAWIYRFGNIIGPRSVHGVIYDFVNKLKENPNELEILGDGNQTKQYLNVYDCLMGITYGPIINNEPAIYNLAHDEVIKVKDIAKIVIDEMKLEDVEITYTGDDRGWIGDVPVSILDNKKIKTYGWKPTISLEDSVRETVRCLLDN